MTRGTTPTLRFNLPFDTEGITDGYITIAQRGAQNLDIPIERCMREGKTLTVTLTQSETLSLRTSRAEIQLRVKIGERIMASKIISADVGRILKEGTI